MKPVMLSAHAKVAAAERGIEIIWVESAARSPDWTEADPDPALERRFRAIPERGGRILRAVCAENDAMIMVVTAFLDRRARRPT